MDVEPSPPPPSSPSAPAGKAAPLWLIQLVGVGILVYTLRLAAAGWAVPLPLWGLIAALVLPAELLRVLLSRWKG